MQFSYFTERPYRGLDEGEILKNKANKHRLVEDVGTEKEGLAAHEK